MGNSKSSYKAVKPAELTMLEKRKLTLDKMRDDLLKLEKKRNSGIIPSTLKTSKK